MEKLSKQDIRGPDAFISTMDRLSQWAYNYRKETMALVTVVALSALIWAGLGAYSAKQEDAAGETLFTAEKTLRTIEEKFEPMQLDQKGQPVKGAKPAAIPTGNIDTDYKDAVTQLNDVVIKFPKTQGSVAAALDLAHIYHQYKKDDASIPLLLNATGVANHSVTKALSLSALGVAYESKGDCANAVSQWQKILDSTDMAPFHANTLIKQALCYEKLNQKDKATAIFGRFEAAESERQKLLENVATKYQLNIKIPLQMQPKKQVEAFEKEVSKSLDVQRLEALLSDRDSVKAAKKYLQLLKQGQS